MMARDIGPGVRAIQQAWDGMTDEERAQHAEQWPELHAAVRLAVGLQDALDNPERLL